MNEEDTFKALKRIPFEEMEGILVESWRNFGGDRKGLDKMYREKCKEHHWTLEDFNKENIRRGSQ